MFQKNNITGISSRDSND